MTGTILANCAGYCEACNGDDRYPHRDSLAVRMQRTVPATTKEPAVSVTTDAVNSPKHYQFFPYLEAIEVIARSMTQEQFYGYCLGNRLKYRLRAGNKGKLEQDIAKSDKYLELYEQYKGGCIDA
ncbi:nucleotide kinase [Klebsiella phage vB_Ko_K66PH128C1]|uniref:Nucleotide kinase n=1 Tax=Klebsiella phage vB_Ko_K66PH128C1 TaxID=3071610 RepID=A0AAD2GQA4_9CAUD|nr:nucleotide kinase [Klebsiella phage vB_Ko_K66PH128C1]